MQSTSYLTTVSAKCFSNIIRFLYYLRDKPCVEIVTEGLNDARILSAALQCAIEYKTVFTNKQQTAGIYSRSNLQLLERISDTLTNKATHRFLSNQGNFNALRQIREHIINGMPYLAVVDADTMLPRLRKDVVQQYVNPAQKHNIKKTILAQLNSNQPGWENNPLKIYAPRPESCRFVQIINCSAFVQRQGCASFSDIKNFYEEHLHTFTWNRGAGELENAMHGDSLSRATYESKRKFFQEVSTSTAAELITSVRDVLEDQEKGVELIRFLQFVERKLFEVYKL